MDLTSIAKYLIFFGVVLVLLGTIFYFFGKLGIGLGKLPGDIIIQKENFAFYFPIATSIIVSIALTIIISLISKR